MQRTDGSPFFRYAAGDVTFGADSRLAELAPETIARLIAIMRGEPSSAPPPAIVEQTSDGVRFTDDAVLTIQGADGDPEMEWEDIADVWAAHPDCATPLSGWTEEEVLAAIDALRGLAGSGNHIRIESIS